jgi:plasmid stability protein
MAQLLVRDLQPETVERLKNRAQRNGRSLQGEIKIILESAAKLSMAETRQVAAQLRQSLEGRIQGDSADLIREDRDR